MKVYIAATLLLFSFTIIGCSSLAPHLADDMETSAYSTAHAIYPMQSAQNSGIDVYQKKPFTLQLGIEEAHSDINADKINGDGGASLNAYAASLTFKVIF